MKLVVSTGGLAGYERRALKRARKLDRGEPIRPQANIVFDDPLAMVEVLTPERLRLVRKIRRKSASISALAAALNRDPKSVRRDVLKLERAGVVRTREEVNPGHGRVRIVEPIAREYRLTAVF
jgi:predicted transcriptional regulator